MQLAVKENNKRNIIFTNINTYIQLHIHKLHKPVFCAFIHTLHIYSIKKYIYIYIYTIRIHIFKWYPIRFLVASAYLIDI